MRKPVKAGRVHLVIPDTQAKPGAPTDHLAWIGQYIVDKYAGADNLEIIHLGDHADMPSLSSYDKGKRQFEGRRYLADIQAANDAFDVLCAPLDRHNRERKARKERQWWPSRRILLGNHENRIDRATENEPMLDGTLSTDHLNYAAHGWTVHPFLEVVRLDGIAYSHYFVNTGNGRPISGMIETRVKQVGCSFVQGHQQGLKGGMVESVAGRRRGIVAGSCYLASEEYRGPQGRGEWRGILVLNECRDGNFDLMELSLDFLCRRYEGCGVGRFVGKKYGLQWDA